MTTTVHNLTPTRPGLAELVERIRECTDRSTDPAETAELVAQVLEQERPTTALLTDDERAGSAGGYVRNTLHTEERFSIMAVVWRPGQASEIHDHIVWCSFLVMQGAETETLFGFEGEHLVELDRMQRPAGSVSGAAPPDDIHRVDNTGDDVAITLHVYGADLSDGSTSVRRVYG
jgi:predicted metal-dependent enzyme (double-stranded beta helix superfamily)